TEDKSSNVTDTYFGLLKNWSGAESPPLNANEYGYSQAIKVYDAQGVAHEVTAYFDGAPSNTSNKVVEFVVGTNPNDPKAAASDGLLMSGTLTFDAKGQLVDMTAFTPNGSTQDLNKWSMAPLANGLPQFNLKGQNITLNLGVAGKGGWGNAPPNAASIGTNQQALPTIQPLTPSARACTAYAGSSATNTWQQDGYSEGTLYNMSINKHGEVIASYSNGQDQVLYEIPICRFTSEDGLRREGGNMFSSTPDAGKMQMGRAGTENYGPVLSNSLELSNVDMAREMVNMIVTQRGFQSNSKVVTTADAMLQKAMELKR
ncbi:MAG: flagellar hook-basal body complex protein, partial [Desulfovibrionaceae bacterium]